MEYNGEIEDFPIEIVEKMLERQVEQGNPKDITVFEKNRSVCSIGKGFNWEATSEEYDFWDAVICFKRFDIFFAKYPKQDAQFNAKNNTMQRLKISVESLSFILLQLQSGELKISSKGSYVHQRQLLAIAEKLINNEPLDKSVVAIKQGNKWLVENNAEFFWAIMLSKYGTFNELEGVCGVFYDFSKKEFFFSLPAKSYEYAVRFDDFLGDSAEVLKTLSKEFIADYAEIKKVIMQYTNFAIHYYEEEV